MRVHRPEGPGAPPARRRDPGGVEGVVRMTRAASPHGDGRLFRGPMLVSRQDSWRRRLDERRGAYQGGKGLASSLSHRSQRSQLHHPDRDTADQGRKCDRCERCEWTGTTRKGHLPICLAPARGRSGRAARALALRLRIAGRVGSARQVAGHSRAALPSTRHSRGLPCPFEACTCRLPLFARTSPITSPLHQTRISDLVFLCSARYLIPLIPAPLTSCRLYSTPCESSYPRTPWCYYCRRSLRATCLGRCLQSRCDRPRASSTSDRRRAQWCPATR